MMTYGHQPTPISIIRMPLHRRDRPDGTRALTHANNGKGSQERTPEGDRRIRVIANYQQLERQQECHESPPIIPNPPTDPQTVQLKEEPACELKSEPQLSDLLNNSPTPSQEGTPTHPQTNSNPIQNQQKLLSLSREISFQTKEFVRKFQEIEEKIKDGCQKVKRRGRPPSKKSQLITKVAEKEKSTQEEKVFDSEESQKDKSIAGVGEIKKKRGGYRRHANLDASISSHLTKKRASARAEDDARGKKGEQANKDDEGRKVIEVKRIRQLEGSVGNHLEYLVQYGPRKHRVMNTLQLIQTHPLSFACYLDSKI